MPAIVCYRNSEHGWPEPLVHQNLYEDNPNCPDVRDRSIQMHKGFNQPRDLGMLVPEDRWYTLDSSGTAIQANNDAYADFQCSDHCASANDWVCDDGGLGSDFSSCDPGTE